MIETAKDISIKELEQQKEWWWVAEKTRSKRLDYLRKAVWKKGSVGAVYAPGIKIDLERPHLLTEAWKANKNVPIMLRKAKALAHVLDNITIFCRFKTVFNRIIGSIKE